MQRKERRRILIGTVIVLFLIFLGLLWANYNSLDEEIETEFLPSENLSGEGYEKFSAIFIDRETDFNEDDILSGGVPKDGIPSIDNPKYVSVEAANEWIRDDALVLALEYNGVKRVYPFQIMTWHEIVNDVVAGDPLLITYCPLCGSGVAFYRVLEGEVVEFGTSGKLYNSNLVMYDRKTESYWTQIGGRAVVGDMKGYELKEVDIDTVEWGEWKEIHKDSEVLSIDTGYRRDYTSDKGPYANYFADDFNLFPGVQNLDEEQKLANKEFVFGIEINGKFKAYPKQTVDEEGIIEDSFAGVNLKIEKKEDGSVDITRLDTGEEVPKEIDFWFAWFAFHPDTELYGF